MRVRMLAGGSRVTVVRPVAEKRARYVTEAGRGSGASEDLKFVVIDPEGRLQRGTLSEQLGEPKKQTRTVRKIDRKIRKLIRSERGALEHYLLLHERSKRKRKNGWVKDLGKNIRTVIRRAT